MRVSHSFTPELILGSPWKGKLQSTHIHYSFNPNMSTDLFIMALGQHVFQEELNKRSVCGNMTDSQGTVRLHFVEVLEK